jgi:hypothetical protein
LYDYSYISLVDKINESDKPLINYKLINKKFSNLLINEKELLIDYIKRSKSLSFDKIPKRKSEYIKYTI